MLLSMSAFGHEGFPAFQKSLQQLLDASEAPCAVVDRAYRFVWANVAYHDLCAREQGDLAGQSMAHVLGEAHFEAVVRPCVDGCLSGQDQRSQRQPPSTRADRRDLEVGYHPLRPAESGEPLVGILVADRTEQHRDEQRIQQLMSILQLNPSPIIITDSQGIIEYANPAYEKSSGYTEDELLGNTPALVKSDNTPHWVHRAMWQQIRSGNIWTGELENRNRNGRLYREYTLIAPIQDDEGEAVNYVAIKQDTTPLDPLTGLYTRVGFSLTVQDWLDHGGWQTDAIVVTLDIVSLRDINDAYGYKGGDQLLCDYTHRLLSFASEGDLVGRMGNGEFTLFLPMAPADSIEGELHRLVDHLSLPFEIQGVDIQIPIRLGFTRLGTAQRPVTSLLQEAETALHHHRSETTLSWVAYNNDLAEQSQERIGLTRDLRRALQNGEFEVHFQPKVELSTGRLIAAEALLRWNHPTRGLISPGLFIPIAEQSQLIAPIGEWALRRACQHLRAWRDEGLDLVRVAVNVSFVQFRTGRFPELVRQVVDETGIEPEQLSLEVTENVFVKASPTLLEQMQALRDMNVRLSLDDFGTGYSSLLYLQQYPFDEIKIDQGFVRQLIDNSFSRDIIEAVKLLAQALDAEIIAEGIESAAVRDELIDMGIDHGQGFYYSWPLEAEDFRWLLERGSRLPLTPDQLH